MIHRMDPPADSGAGADARADPADARRRRRASRATRSKWSFEVKWDGVRAIAYVKPGRLRLESRNLNEITDAYPEVRGILRDLGMREAVFDGEIVAFDDGRAPQLRAPAAAHARDLGQRGPPPGAEHAGRLRDLRPALPRRPLADGAALRGAAGAAGGARSSAARRGGCRPPTRGGGRRCWTPPRPRAWRAFVAKRLDSRYEPGRRTGAWVKIKHIRRQELVICGWLPGEGRRTDRIGALLMGYWTTDGAPALRRARGHRLHRAHAQRAGAHARPAAPCRQPVRSTRPSSRATRRSSSPTWWPRSSSASGRPRA